MPIPTATVTIERLARFSVSKIWQCQEQYFDNSGINAWVHGVPFYVTSNALIAHGFSQKIFRFIQDAIKNNTASKKEPFYIFELGTGSGKFSYLFLTALYKLLEQYQINDLKIIYVMTDFTEHNMQYWKNHPGFKKYLDNQQLDFAIYKIGEEVNLTLSNQQIVLTPDSINNPVIAIANYIFDTVPHDVFRIKEGVLQEGLISMQTAQDNIHNDVISSLEKLETDFTFRDVELPYYNDPNLDQILSFYLENLTSGTFLIPIGAISAINFLNTLTTKQLFIVSSDKGYTTSQALENLETPHIAFHGSFSMMVNFDAISRYIKNIGGDSLLTTNTEGMKVNVFLTQGNFRHYPDTSWAFDEYARRFSTKEFLLVKNEMIDHANNLNAQQILALLKLSYWDPDIFMAISSVLANLITQTSVSYQQEICSGLNVISQNYYHMPKGKNVPFEVARIYHVLGKFDMAIDSYQLAMSLYGEESAGYFNVALCYYHAGDTDNAEAGFNKALALDSNNSAAAEWLEFIKN